MSSVRRHRAYSLRQAGAVFITLARRSLRVVLPLLMLTANAEAQFTLRSSISGIVSDPSGAVVPGARVTLVDVDRNQRHSALTSETGEYTFTNLTSGRYKVEVEHEGFQKTVSDVVTLGIQENSRLDLTLRVGEVTQTVEVTSAASPILREESSVGQITDRTFVENLPSLGRNFTNFVLLASNISSFRRGNEGGTWAVGGHHLIGGTDYVVGGGGTNGFYMNGVNINDNWVGGLSYAPSMEAVAEVKLDVANFSAESGRDISTLNVVTRSGTSTYHGSVFEYLQNEALNAWHPIVKAEAIPGQKKDFLRRHQFGGHAGGPLRIPGVLRTRDRAFFFASFEATRENRGGESAIFRVPTPEERQGNFSALLQRFPGDPNFVLYDPFSTGIDSEGNSSRTPIPNNELRTVNRPDGSPLIDPRAQELLGIFPLPNGYQNPNNPNDLSNYRTFAAFGQDNYRFDTRFDFRVSNRDNFYVAFSRSQGKDDNRGGLFPDLTANIEDTSRLLTVNYARIFAPNVANEFTFAVGKGLLYNVDDSVIEFMRRTDTLRTRFFNNIGGSDVPGLGNDIGIFALDMASYGNAGHWEVFFASNPTLQFSDNLTWVRGNHTIKTGLNYFRKKEFDNDIIRAVVFDPLFTSAGSVGDYLGGDTIASLLIGLPSFMLQRYNITGGDLALDFVMPYWGMYVQDNWRVSRRLTLNLGLRYDLVVPTFSANRYGAATIDFSVPEWQLAIPGRATGLPHHFVPADKNNFAPRFGFAYRLRDDFVIRGAYGVFYDGGSTNTGGVFMGELFNSVPGYVGDEFTNSRFGVHDDLPVMTFDDIFPPPQSLELGTYPESTGPATGYFGFPATIHFMDRESGTVPYYQRYLFELQKEVWGKTVLSLTYLGGRGTKLPYWENINKPPYQTGWPSEDDFNAARPNNSGRWADLRVRRQGHNSFYNAFTIKAQRSLSRGLQFVSHYTFSKTVSDFVEFKPENLAISTPRWDWNRRLGRGEAEFSHPHRFVTALTFRPPWGRGLPPVAKAFLSGWDISTITHFESGNALTVFNGITSARDFEPDLPNLTGQPNLPRGQRTFTRYFNTDAFAAPPQDVKGSAGVGVVRGLGVNNWDIAIAKSFYPAKERVRLDLRADFFNAFNHTQWSEIDTVLSSAADSTFGWVTDAREARITQISLRISF